MPRAFQLTYDKKNQWWVKVVGGEKLYLLKASTKGDRAAYLQALRIYHERLPSLLSKAASASSPASIPSGSRRTTRTPNKQLRYAVDRYIYQLEARTLVQTQARRITKGYVEAVAIWLRPLVSHLGAEFPIAKITEDDVLQFIQAQTSLVRTDREKRPNTISGNSLRQRLVNVKAFLRWCWRQRFIDELPRNIVDLTYGISTPDKTPFSWKKRKRGSTSELEDIIAECRRHSPMLYLCCLLGLNCGFTMRDIADLKASEFRWKSTKWARIKRHRSKTTGFGSWVLWTETERMLRQEMVAKDADYNSDKRLLAKSDGTPLMPPSLRGRCALAYSFKRVVQRVCGKNDPRSFITLRKTGASLCHAYWPGTEVLFLAHTPSTMAAKFYVDTRVVGKIDWVLCKMEHELGLSEVLVKRYSEEPERPSRASQSDYENPKASDGATDHPA